jgi:Spy/CpxP family protein refolding chaperone
MKPRQFAVIMMIISFILGLGSGILIGNRFSPFSADEHKSGKDIHRKNHLLKEFTSQLNLTPEQQKKLDAALENMRRKFRELRETMEPKYKQIRSAFIEEVNTILTPEQREKFGTMKFKMERGKKRKYHRK